MRVGTLSWMNFSLASRSLTGSPVCPCSRWCRASVRPATKAPRSQATTRKRRARNTGGAVTHRPLCPAMQDERFRPGWLRGGVRHQRHAPGCAGCERRCRGASETTRACCWVCALRGGANVRIEKPAQKSCLCCVVSHPACRARLRLQCAHMQLQCRPLCSSRMSSWRSPVLWRNASLSPWLASPPATPPTTTGPRC